MATNKPKCNWLIRFLKGFPIKITFGDDRVFKV